MTQGKEEQRQKRIYARLTEEEYSNLKAQADVAAISLSEYVRRRIFERQVASKLDLRTLAELRRLGGLVKHVFSEGGGAYSELTRDALQALTSCARTLERRIRSDWESPSETPGQPEQL